jgi:hypothetical protein
MNTIFQHSIIPLFQLCLLVIALAQARRAGAKRTKFLHAKSTLLPLNHKEKHLKYSVIEST